MQYNLLKKLTLVIFTYNRHKSLKRTIKYWANYGLKLVILDGSEVRLKDPCLKSKNIKYIYSPNSYYDRVLSSINYIDTEFVIMGSDDEFYLPSALKSCILFLIKESNFSCCGGITLGFGKTEKGILHGNERYPHLRNINLNHNLAKKRIYEHFSNYVPAHYYSVLRTNVWKKICKHVFVKEYNFSAACELQLEFLVLVNGKTKIIHEIMWIRNLNENTPHRDMSPASIDSFTINDWWNDKKYENERKNFFNKMKIACDDLSVNKNNKLKKDEIASLFKSYIRNSLFVNKNFSRKILDLIPLKIKNLIKFFLRRYNSSFMDEVAKLEKKKVLANHKELDLILTSLKVNENGNQY